MTVIWWAFGYHSKLDTSWLSFTVPTWELFFSEHSFISSQGIAVPGKIHLHSTVFTKDGVSKAMFCYRDLRAALCICPHDNLLSKGLLGLKINSVYFKVDVMLFREKIHASKRLKKRKTGYDLLFLEVFDSWNCAGCRTRQGCTAEVANSSWCCRYWRGELGKDRFTPSAPKVSY